MTDQDDVLTIREVARELRCSKAHVYNAIKGKVSGVSTLPAITMGRRLLVRRGSLDRWKRVNERATGGHDMLPASPEVDAVERA
jgi:excisionase family DNA binding protein